MIASLLDEKNQATSNLREFQGLEQHKLNIHLSLERVKADIFELKLLNELPNQAQLQHQVPQPTTILFQIGNIVQLTNHFWEKFGICC